MRIARTDSLASITVVIPTLNRSTLERTVQSAEGADEVIVVGDRAVPAAGQIRLQECPRSAHREGRAAELRNAGMRRATGDWIAFMDDDDAFTPGAIDAIRKAVSGKPPALYLFRMIIGGYGMLWSSPVLEINNVGTPMIVCPSHDWRPWPTGGYPCEDYGFADLNKDAWPGGVVFREEIIAHVRPPA
jgi:glycosyltransferase involved in cell wall biosynthesis